MINDYEATQPISPEGSFGRISDPDVDMAFNSDYVSILNGLIEVCKDGEFGFQTAAESTERSDLKEIFNKYEQQRAQFATALQGHVRILGGDPETSGSIGGAIRRGWMDFKSAITGNSDEAILNECERGEDVAKDAYAAAMKENLPSNIQETILNQAKAIMATHVHIRSLRDGEKARSASANNR